MIDNLNKHNYDEVQMKHRENFIPIIKNNILKNLADLITKIESEEAFPHGNQDLDFLCEVDDKINIILNNWYY